MSSLLEGIDVTQPCLVWPKLQAALYELVAGQARSKVQFDRRTLEYHPADIKGLTALVAQLKADCERSQGRRTRFAVRAGFYPGPRGPWTGCD